MRHSLDKDGNEVSMNLATGATVPAAPGQSFKAMAQGACDFVVDVELINGFMTIMATGEAVYIDSVQAAAFFGFHGLGALIDVNSPAFMKAQQELVKLLTEDRPRRQMILEQGPPRAQRQPNEQTIFNFLTRKYVQRADARQADLGLQYMEAETHDLARELAKWLKG